MRYGPTATNAWRITALVCGWCILSAGCERQPGQSTTAPAAEDAPATSTAPAEPAPPRPADGKDDPAAPRELPRSSELQNWIKTEPVTVADRKDMAGLIGDDAVTRILQAYRTKQVARCKYESPNAIAHVLLAELATADDAFGAFTILNPDSGCSVRDDGSLYASKMAGTSLILSACQSRVIMIANCTLADPQRGTRDCERLVARTLFSVPATETPLLARAVHDMKTQACALWLVRSTALLTKLDRDELKQLNPSQTDARLGLKGTATLAVVSARASAADEPMLIWLAEYESPEAAQAAAQSYAQATQPAETSLDKRTLIGVPKGRCVVGTWTADQNNARELVRLLEEALVQP